MTNGTTVSIFFEKGYWGECIFNRSPIFSKIATYFLLQNPTLLLRPNEFLGPTQIGLTQKFIPMTEQLSLLSLQIFLVTLHWCPVRRNYFPFFPKKKVAGMSF